MSEKIYNYKSEKVNITYEPKLCIHAAECAKGLPAVFNPENKPWVNPEAASVDEIAQVIHKCPTGALKYDRYDGGQPEPTPAGAVIKTVPDGPIYVQGKIELKDNEGNTIAEETRLALCRCGHSNNKPFCDNKHLEVNFNAE